MKRKLIFTMLVVASMLQAQDIVNTLGTGGTYSIRDAANTYFKLSQATGHIGIGTNVPAAPRAELEVGGYDGLVVTGLQNIGTPLALGAGVRMQWYPRKGAFRVGAAETTYWDDNGSSTPNMALFSIGMGYQVRATATASYALGAYCRAIDQYALALGSYSQASGIHAIAIGTQVYASGIYSIAMGSGADTNGKDGAMVIGDDTYFETAYARNDNEFTARFSGGFRLWSSYPDSTAGVYMRHGQSGWSNYCSKYNKENFSEVDEEIILGEIRDLPVTEWNIKGTPDVRYIGPTAQDFAATFHLAGNDTSGISTVCMDGINIVGVKALEKRTSALRTEIEALKTGEESVRELRTQIDQLKEENRVLREEIASVRTSNSRDAEIESLKAELKKQGEILQSLKVKQ